ncbi:MAG: hypothetical protein HY020_27105 [Burkholderiales bacterium]|nr:hypothetical protein [Burkholderiales bacterium]
MTTPSTQDSLEDPLGPRAELSQSISSLDALIQALLSELPPTKPWQRQLLLHLSQAERDVQILRMTIAMHRSNDDICEAARRVHQTLRAAHACIATGRADAGTKASVNIAMLTSRKISKALPGSDANT